MGFPRWRNPGVKGTGRLLEAGKLKRVGSGIPKVEEPRSKGDRKSTGGRKTEEGGKWDSQGDRNPGVKGTGSLLEAGKLKRVGSGIPKVEEPRSKGDRKSTGGRRTEEGGKWDSQGGGNPEVKGGGSLLGVGGLKRVGSGIPKVTGTQG